MANYDSNYAIAQEISARIGTSPIPFDSVYSIALEIYNELGGEPAEFDSVYSILLGILPLVEGGVASKIIDDSVITTAKTWSSSKINSELNTKASIDYVDEQIEAVIGAGNSDIEGKETEDFTFVQTLPVEGEEGQQVIIKGDNTDTLYKYVSGEWVEQTPDATKLYFDTEHEVLYSYATAEHQFVRISMVNTIVVGSNLNTNADLKAIKTVGVYNVVQRLHNTTKGDYVKNWTLYVESIDYEEYDRSDSVYQRLVSNYTIQKRTWSATRATNDGWSNFSTYYAGEIKDTTTSKYYTWSSNKISSELASKENAYDLIVGFEQAQEGAIPTLKLSDFDNLTTDGVYTFIVKTDLLTGTEETIGFGKAAVINDSSREMVIQAIEVTYNLEATKTENITRFGVSDTWQNYQFTNAVIDDEQNPYASFPWSTYSATKINELLATKQGVLTAGANISISGGTISATDTTYVASDFDIKDLSDSTGLRTAWSGKQDALVAGEGIEISGNTISCNVEPLQAGENISVENGRINALGYKFDENKWSFSELYGREVQSLNQVIPISQVGMSDVKVTGLANSTTYTVSGADVAQFLQMMPSMLSVINTIMLSNGKTGVISSIDATNSTITVTETIDAVNALNEVPIAAFLMAIEITLSGAANATTYTYTEPEEILSPTSTKFMIIEGYGEREAIEINTTNHTITFTETLDAENAVTDALIEAFVSYNSLASGEGSHSEGIDTEAKGRGTHAEGQSTSASGSFGAHAEGYYTVANGESSHAEGCNTKTNNTGEHAEGFNNVSHSLDRYQTSHKTISSIGIGDSSTSKNGVEVMWSGDMYLYGVGGYDGVHIKHETGYSNVKTLQEVVNSKADAYETATTADIEAMFS